MSLQKPGAMSSDLCLVESYGSSGTRMSSMTSVMGPRARKPWTRNIPARCSLWVKGPYSCWQSRRADAAYRHVRTRVEELERGRRPVVRADIGIGKLGGRES